MKTDFYKISNYTLDYNSRKLNFEDIKILGIENCNQLLQKNIDKATFMKCNSIGTLILGLFLFAGSLCVAPFSFIAVPIGLCSSAIILTAVSCCLYFSNQNTCKLISLYKNMPSTFFYLENNKWENALNFLQKWKNYPFNNYIQDFYVIASLNYALELLQHAALLETNSLEYERKIDLACKIVKKIPDNATFFEHNSGIAHFKKKIILNPHAIVLILKYGEPLTI